MDTIQNSVLVLYGSLLVANTTNRYGTANSLLTDLTFSNINMKQILGTNYDKYNKFNIILNSVIIQTNTVNMPSGNQANAMVYMSGLPFDSGSTYSAVTGLNTNNTYIGAIRFTTGTVADSAPTSTTSSLVTFPGTFFNTISKPDPICNISIGLRSSVATITATGATFNLSGLVYPTITYTFMITPVLETRVMDFPSQEEQNLVYKQRMFKS